MFTKRIGLSLVALFLFTGVSGAQNQSIDHVINTLYKSISFSKNQAPDYETFKSLFANNGKLISVKDTSSFSLTPADYEKMMNQQRNSGSLQAFMESELHRTTEQFGNIAHVFSTYKSEVKNAQGTVTERGINSIQLMQTSKGWKVVSLIWQEAGPNLPLPDGYLPSSDSTSQPSK